MGQASLKENMSEFSIENLDSESQKIFEELTGATVQKTENVMNLSGLSDDELFATYVEAKKMSTGGGIQDTVNTQVHLCEKEIWMRFSAEDSQMNYHQLSKYIDVHKLVQLSDEFELKNILH